MVCYSNFPVVFASTPLSPAPDVALVDAVDWLNHITEPIAGTTGLVSRFDTQLASYRTASMIIILFLCTINRIRLQRSSSEREKDEPRKHDSGSTSSSHVTTQFFKSLLTTIRCSYVLLDNIHFVNKRNWVASEDNVLFYS